MRDLHAYVILLIVSIAIVVTIMCGIMDGPSAEAANAPVDIDYIPVANLGKVSRGIAELSVEIRPGPFADPIRGTSSVTIRFHNAGPAPAYLLKKLDGSEVDAFMPYYRFSVRDARGWPLETQRFCKPGGLWADTKWPEDYLVKVEPDSSTDLEFEVTSYFQVRQPGPHRISFEYVYLPSDDWIGGWLDPPLLAWRGCVRAPDVILNLKGR